MTTTLKAGEGAIWIQPDGPNTECYYLGCHNLADIARPRGDKTLKYKPDPSGPNRWKVSNSFRGEPGAVTTTVEFDLALTADYIETLGDCPGALYVHQGICDRMDEFLGYRRGFALPESEVTDETYSNLTAKDPASQEIAMGSFDISADDLYKYYDLTGASVVTGSTVALNAISFFGKAQCAGPCGPASAKCDLGVAAGDMVPAATAIVYITQDGGQTWSAAATQPFAADEIISAVVGLVVDPTAGTYRIIAARGTTDAGNPAEIAYSDNLGTTWTTVNLGSTVAEYVAGPNGLIALDKRNIWVVTTGGFIYKSSDGGASFSVSNAAAMTTEDLHAVDFINRKIGMVSGTNDAVGVTTDGGTTWTLLTATGSAATLLSVAVHSQYDAWVTTSNGRLYYTDDGGVTWNRRTGFTGDGGVSIPAQRWLNRYIGAILVNVTGPIGKILMTINGGYDWKEQELFGSTNAGLNHLFLCNERTLFAVGEPVTSVAKAYKVSAPITSFDLN